MRAYRAMGKMLAAPGRSVTFLGERVKPAPAAEARRVAALIADLGSEQFKVRDRATKELEKLGEVAAPALQKACTGNPSLEVKRRLEVLLEKLSNWPAETLRQVRCIGAALLARDLSPDRPVVILSGNDIEHALLGLAALHVGIPYAPISPAYSLVSKDFGKLRMFREFGEPLA